MHLPVNGMTYHVKVVGEGQPFLLLHGFTGSLSTWEPFKNEWIKDFKLIRIDLLGHGDSSCPDDPERYSMENTVEDIIAILDYLRIDKVRVLGYSLGGRVALSLAIMYPNKVKAVILESSSPGLYSKQERFERQQSDEALANDIEVNGIVAFVNRWEKIPLFESQQNILELEKQKLRKQRLANHPRGLANSLRGLGTGVQPQWWDRLERINIPVLFIVGELDQKFCKLADKMSKLVPNSEKIKVSGAGHAIHVEEPVFFGKIVSRWFCDKI